MDTNKNTETKTPAKPFSPVPLAAPPLPKKPGTPNATSAEEKWPDTAPPGQKFVPKVDTSDPEAVKAAAKAWMESQRDNICIA